MSGIAELKSDLKKLEKMRKSIKVPRRIIAEKINLSQTKTFNALNLIEPLMIDVFEKFENARLIGKNKMDLLEFKEWTRETTI